MTRRGLVAHPAAEHYRKSGYWTDHTLIEQWQRIADEHPGSLAVVATDGRMTYRELSVATDRVAAGLLERGLAPGDRVLFQITNRLDAATAWYGMLKAGLIPVCTLAAHRHHEISAITRRSGAAAHLVEALPNFDMLGFAADIAATEPSLRHTITVGARRDDPGVRIEDLAATGNAEAARVRVAAIQRAIDPDDMAVLQLSGGTTGTPKLIPRLHHEYWLNAREYARVLGWDSSARVAHLLPIVHNAGIVCALHGAHSVGGAAVLLPPAPDVALPVIADEGVTDVLVGGPINAVRDAFVKYGTELRRVIVAGAKPQDGLFETFEEAGVWVGQLYGMAEGMFLMTPLDAPRAARRHSVGVALCADDDVLVLSPDSEEPVAPGQVGELCVRGPYTIAGYFDDRDEEQAQETAAHNARAFTSAGYYRTGDLGMARAEDGFACFSVEGRIKDVIDRGGEKISVEEVEALLAGHPDLAQVAVVAYPDERLGERACAVVVPHPGASVALTGIQQYLAGRGVAKFKWPERVQTMDELPRTAVGKIDKRALREVVTAARADS